MNRQAKDCATCCAEQILLAFALTSMMAALVGCVEGRSSTHELEHVVPAHWPTSLTDAADKIQARLAAIEAHTSDSAQARIELGEIVSWLPEVAADTAMRETDWNTIHAACQTIETLMKQADQWQQVDGELRALCAKLPSFPGDDWERTGGESTASQ